MKNTLKEMLIGTILGDAHIGKTGLDKAFISFEQSKKKLEYLKFLFEISKKEGLSLEELKTYTRNDQRYKKINESVYFRTKSLESLKPLADMFLNKEGKKIIPSNISEILTPRSLAFWLMDDGQQVKRGGVTLCTDSYKSEEVDTLRKALKTNFNLITSIHTKTNKNSESIYERIYINKSSLDNIKPLLKEHMHDSMLYKINETPESLLEEGDITDIDSDIGEF
jgi:hypothetical protein